MAELSNSILITVKKMLGIAADYEHFDMDIMIHINSTFATLHQLGVGPTVPFKITGPEETWDQFTDETKLDSVKTYMYLKVKMLFDPPVNSFVLTSLKEQAQEYEWRLNVASDTVE